MKEDEKEEKNKKEKNLKKKIVPDCRENDK